MVKYKCAECEGVFTSERSDEDAQAEAEALHPDVPMCGMMIVCDDCYKRIMGVQ